MKKKILCTIGVIVLAGGAAASAEPQTPAGGQAPAQGGGQRRAPDPRSMGGGDCRDNPYNCADAPNPLPAVNTVWLEEMTWMDVRDALKAGKTTVIIPTGGIEPNGPWLALGKHNYVLRANCDAIARKLGNALCAPIIELVPEGSIDPKRGHMVSPGTISMREETFQMMLTDVAHSLKMHGQRIAFYSNRGGSYEVWVIRPDGSGLEPLTAAAGSNWAPHWSPDGTRLAVEGPRPRLFDLRRPLKERKVRELPPIAEGVFFRPTSWSPDGTRLEGQAQREDGFNAGVFVHTLDANSYEKLTDRGGGATWLADGRHLLYTDAGALFLFDPASRQARELLPPQTLAGFSLSADNRWLTFYQQTTEGDVWLLSFEPSPASPGVP